MKPEIAQLGNPVLRQKTKAFSLDQLKLPETKQFIKNLKQTLKKEEGLGLAAPQLGQLKQIVAVCIPPELLGHKTAGVPLQILVNPKIVHTSPEIILDWEGCLSFNFLRGLVPRYQSITVEALDANGAPLTIEAFDLFARALQHEIDHLDGILYLDRMTDIKSLMSTEEFERQYGDQIAMVE